MKSKKLRFLSVTLSLLLVFTGGCSSKKQPSSSDSNVPVSPASASEAADVPADTAATTPDGRYSETVTITLGRGDFANSGLPEGESLDNSAWTKYLTEKLNIEVKDEWLTADAETAKQKAAMVLATGDMPDVMIVDYSTFKQLSQNDMLADLTQAYSLCATDRMKEAYSSYADNRVLGMATIDGRLFALPSTITGYQQDMLWVRQDWLDKLNLPMPTTMEEIKKVAKAFVEQDPDGDGQDNTIGLGLFSSIAGTYNGPLETNLIFGLYNAFPRQWIKDSSGNAVYGSVQPEMKPALAELAQMYQEGLIDKDFATRGDYGQIIELVASGKMGMAFGAWWIPNLALKYTIQNDPGASWMPVMAPVDASGKARQFSQNPAGDFLVVSKDCKNPEAVVKAIGLQWGAFNLDYPDVKEKTAEYYENDVLKLTWQTLPIPLLIASESSVLDSGKQLYEAAAAGTDEKMDEANKSIYQAYMANKQNPGADATTWGIAASYYEGLNVAGNPNYEFVDPVFFGTTETMETKWTALKKMEDEILLKIVMGVEPVDSFDKFAEDWNSLGGEEITAEVNAEIAR